MLVSQSKERSLNANPFRESQLADHETGFITTPSTLMNEKHQSDESNHSVKSARNIGRYFPNYNSFYSRIHKLRIWLLCVVSLFIVIAIFTILGTLLQLKYPLVSVRNDAVGFIYDFYPLQICGRSSLDTEYTCSTRSAVPFNADLYFSILEDQVWLKSFSPSFVEYFCDDVLNRSFSAAPLAIASIGFLMLTLVICLGANVIHLFSERAFYKVMPRCFDRTEFARFMYILSMIAGLGTFALCATLSISAPFEVYALYTRHLDNLLNKGGKHRHSTGSHKPLPNNHDFGTDNWSVSRSARVVGGLWAAAACLAVAVLIQIFAHFHLFFHSDEYLWDEDDEL